MEPTKISLTKKSIIEPTIFMATAFFAGTPRLIQYFPGATKSGLLLTGGLVGAACAIHDYKYEGHDFTFLRKLTAIGLASLISLGLTQSLKGRVSLSFANTLKIVFFGGAITLLKNWVEHLPPKKAGSATTNAVSGTQLTAEEALTPLPETKKEIRIGAGRDIECIIYQSVHAQSGAGTRGTVTLIDHVYETTDDQGRQGLLMRSEDFTTLQSNVCHEGAFGSDYRRVDGALLPSYGFQAVENRTFMFLWKIPADLKKINSYVVDKSVSYTQHDVGKYRLLSDFCPKGLSEPTQGIIDGLQKISATKIRSDFSDGVTPSTHHLILENTQTNVPGISTANFFHNFNDPQPNEIEKIQVLSRTLATFGFGAYLCNSQQHMIIIGTYQEKAISPQELADLFRDSETVRGQVLGALRLAATENSFDGNNMKEKIEPWMDAYIRRFQTI